MSPPAEPMAQSADGSWRSEGYGFYVHIAGPTLDAYEVTAISCLPSFTATRQGETGSQGDVTFTVTDDPVTFVVRAGDSPDQRRLHMNGAASDVVIHRLASKPKGCDAPLPDTPLRTSTSSPGRGPSSMGSSTSERPTGAQSSPPIGDG